MPLCEASGAVVGSWVYEYSDATQANTQYERAKAKLDELYPGATVLYNGEGVPGKAWRYSGIDADEMHLLMRPKEHAVLVLTVNGLPDDSSARGRFDDLMHVVLNR
jgi:hypothetical protein